MAFNLVVKLYQSGSHELIDSIYGGVNQSVLFMDNKPSLSLLMHTNTEFSSLVGLQSVARWDERHAQ